MFPKASNLWKSDASSKQPPGIFLLETLWLQADQLKLDMG